MHVNLSHNYKLTKKKKFSRKLPFSPRFRLSTEADQTMWQVSVKVHDLWFFFALFLWGGIYFKNEGKTLRNNMIARKLWNCKCNLSAHVIWRNMECDFSVTQTIQSVQWKHGAFFGYLQKPAFISLLA